MHRPEQTLFRHFAALIACFALSVSPAGETPGDFSGEILIGATFPLSGELEPYGQSAYYGANASVRAINAAGGVNGKKLVLEWRDNGSDPDQAVRDVEELAAQYHVPAILGPLLSDAFMAVRPIANRLKTVIMSPMAAVDAATLGNEWMFRSTFTNSAQAEGMIRFQLAAYGAQSCAILFDSRHIFCVELAQLFEKKFREHGGAVLTNRSFITANGQKDYAAALAFAAELKPDFIFVPSYALEATEIVQAARDLSIPIRFAAPHTWDNELTFYASGRRLARTAIVSSLFEQSFSYRPFQTFYNALEQAGMDTPDAQAAGAWDAVRLLAEALKNGETAEQVRDGLLGVKRMALATGRTTMSPQGDALKPVLIRVVEERDGFMVPIYAERYDPETLAQKP